MDPTSELNDRIVRPLARRLNRAVFLDRVTGPLLAVFVATAGAHLLMKMLLPSAAHLAGWVLTVLPATAFVVFLLCRQRRLFFTPAETAEVVDHLYRDDGLVTAVYESPALTPGPDFAQALRSEMRGRYPRLKMTHYLRRIGPPAAFCAVALVIPPRPTSVEQQRQQVLEAITQPLAEQLEGKQDLLTEEQKAELMKDLELVKETDQGVSKEQWEAVEEIQQRIEDTVKQNEANVSQMASSLNELSSIVQLGSGDSSTLGLTPDLQARVDNISQDLTLRGQNPKLPMSAAQRKAMSEMLKNCKGGNCNKEGLCNGLSKLAKELEGKCKGKDGDGNCIGRGGLNRGRGDAPYVLGEENKLGSAAYQDKQVENKYLSSEDLVDMGITPVEPKVDPGRFTPGTVREFGPSQGTQVSRTRISPSQKDVISRYFGK